MGTNRDIKSDGNVNITSTQTNISGDLDVTGSINNFNFPGSDGDNGQALVTNGSGTLSFADVLLDNATVAMILEGLSSGDQALSNATATKVVNWGAAAQDTHSKWDTGNSKYVIPSTGYYEINFKSHVTDEASTVGLTSVTAHIYVDGSPKQRKTERQPAHSNGEAQVIALLYLTADQYIEFYTRYDGDGNVDASNDVFNGSQYTFASIHKVK